MSAIQKCKRSEFEVKYYVKYVKSCSCSSNGSLIFFSLELPDTLKNRVNRVFKLQVLQKSSPCTRQGKHSSQDRNINFVAEFRQIAFLSETGLKPVYS